MSEWKKVKLGECCYIGDGAHASLKREKEGILYITAKNISNNSIDYSNVSYISKETYNKHFKEKTNAITRPQKNDILYSIIGTIGGCILLKDETLGISSSIAIFRSKGSILSEYLYYYIKSSKFQTKIESIKGGVAQGFMSLSKLGTINIEYPSDEKKQKNIVSILSRYDSLIENYQKQIKLLEESAQRLYKEWFVDLRFPGHENTKIVDGVPEGWEKKCLGELACFKRGKTITKKEIIEGNIPVVAGGIEPAYYCNKSNTGNRVVTISASGANAGYTRMYFEKIWASDCSFIDTSITDFLHFVYCFLIANKIAIDNLQKGAAQPHVYPKDINSLELCCPHRDILDCFETKISYYFDLISSLQTQIKKLTEARDRLLPKLMSGEIEV
ncbi:restriction endonuclease subunit S [Bacteroides caecigallinarum]|uniref:restriction endonuclease subunit S n=1 Tax=Bacteroides caecigallinarum TaxID=1411144 RepID=UPI001F39348F|nr:restriction endonuclease subunit S [Bacteroides caecigallinarum]MCF2736262.1 restriction endonuclease subunit S [Bacteroides caecigallinarum]